MAEADISASAVSQGLIGDCFELLGWNGGYLDLS